MEFIVPDIEEINGLLDTIIGNMNKVKKIRSCMENLHKKYEKHIMFLKEERFNFQEIGKIELKKNKKKSEFNYKENVY